MALTSNSLKTKIIERLTNAIMNPSAMSERVRDAVDAVDFEEKDKYTEDELLAYSNNIWYGICKGITDHLRLNSDMWTEISAAIIEEIQEHGQLSFPLNLDTVTGGNIMTPRVRYTDSAGNIKYGYLSVYNDTFNQLGVVHIVPEETADGTNDVLPINQTLDESINPNEDKDDNTIGIR